MDGGKPIRESRDIDVPLAAAHFFHYAGWADKLATASPAATAAGVVAQIVPWNFPLLMAAWKLAPALACGNTAMLKPAETTPLTALLLAEICQEAELPPGVVYVLTGRRRDRRRAGARPRHRQGRLHRLHGRRQGHPGRAGRPRRRPHARARRQSANIIFEDARSTRRSRASSRGSSSTRATSAVRLAPVGAGERRRAVRGEAVGAHARSCASATRSTRTPTSARSDRASSSSRSRRSSPPARRGRHPPHRRLPIPERGHWFAPTLFTEVSSRTDRGRGDLRPGRLDAPPSARQKEAIEKANNSKYGLTAGI